ncbi:MAG: ASCH domain-containing protein, partial [Daejeonella sp.]
MRVLLSIKPEFAELIFDGTKKFEFRKAVFKNTDIKTVVVYASSPTQKVIGEFEIESILNDSPEKLWKITKAFAGINEDFFYQYFSDRDTAYAIKIKKTRKYRKPLCLKEDFKLTPPQSF